MAIEPVIKLPTGDAKKGLGNGDAEIELPLILGYKTGPWELGSEIGYSHVFRQHEDNAYIGFLAMRRVSKTLRLGAEIVVDTPDARFREFGTQANVGFKWRAARRIEISGLAGRTLSTPDHKATNKFKLDVEFKF